MSLREFDSASTCPTQRTQYPSRMTSENAIALHRLARPACPGIEMVACKECGEYHLLHDPEAICRSTEDAPEVRARVTRRAQTRARAAAARRKRAARKAR